MIQITILCIGKIKESYLRDGIREYLKRLGTLAKVRVQELKEVRSADRPSAAQIVQIKEAEGLALKKNLPAGCYHIVLDRNGETLSSENLAKKLNDLAISGKTPIVFTIGGSFGLGTNILKTADLVISFGKMTFPHQLMRLILLEQVYRACKINAGHFYHK